MKARKFSLLGASMFALLIFNLSACKVAEEEGYGAWDADRNEMLDTNEFGAAWTEAGYYDRWDANRDSYIDENEWNAGRNAYMRDYDTDRIGAYSDWDVDADGRLMENEFRDGVFGAYDADRDGFWADNEYGSWWGSFNAGL